MGKTSSISSEMDTPQSLCEEAEFERSFRSNGRPLRNFLLYKGAPLLEAEDLMQEAFIRLWENCSKVQVEKAKSFLFTVANNLFLNQKTREKVVWKFEKSYTSSSLDSRPDGELEGKEFQARLEAAIQALPPGQREVFLLNRIEKMTYAEMAKTLGVSVKAIEKRMHKALARLAKDLGPYRL